MTDSNAILKTALRMFAVLHPKQRANIEAIVRSPKKLAALKERLAQRKGFNPDNLIKLLDWFVKNAPAIIAIIKKIVAMFV